MPTTTEFLTAIVIVIEPHTNRRSGKKYTHNIKNTLHYKTKFARDMKGKFIDAVQVNFYKKSSGEFLETYHY